MLHLLERSKKVIIQITVISQVVVTAVNFPTTVSLKNYLFYVCPSLMLELKNVYGKSFYTQQPLVAWKSFLSNETYILTFYKLGYKMFSFQKLQVKICHVDLIS